jgi:cytochrome P450
MVRSEEPRPRRRLLTCSERKGPVMMVRIDFTSQDYLRNPAAGMERLRTSGPVVKVRFPIIGRTWITTTQEAADRMLKDSWTFTLRKDGGEIAGLQWWMPGIFRALASNMLTADEPHHTRLRSIVDEAFRRRAILDMEPTSWRSPTSLPPSCSRKAALLTSSPATHESCRSR